MIHFPYSTTATPQNPCHLFSSGMQKSPDIHKGKLHFWTLFEAFSPICPKVRRLSIQVGEESKKFLGICQKSS